MEQLEIPAPLPPPRLQFGLKTILSITTAFALLFASGWWFGFIGYVGFFVLAAIITLMVNPQMKHLEKLVLGGAILVIVGLFWPAIHEGRKSNQHSTCTSHLKQLGGALQNYNDVYKCFPPVYTTDQDGKPMHSWRVLILPFIGQQALYAKYDLNEPWDGPHNSQLAKFMPPEFRCPSDDANPGSLTDYVAVIGRETIWQPDGSTTFAEITDGPSNTIAVIEAAGAGINWMEPHDLPFVAVAKGVNPKQGPGISSHHSGVVIAMFADGHTQTIEESIPLATLKALFTKAGGEQLDGDF